MYANLAVVEIKSIKGRLCGIEKDLDTLSYFVAGEPAYKFGVYLVYGQSRRNVERFKIECRKRLDFAPFALKLMWHAQAGRPAEPVPL